MAKEQSFIDYKKALADIDVGYGDYVGDFGAGTAAFFTMEAARLVGDKGRVYAVDVVKNVLRAIEGRAVLEGVANVITVWSNLEIYGATKIPDASLDSGILVNVLFQSQKKSDIIREIDRTLKPGAKFLIADWKKRATPLGPPLDLRFDEEEIRPVMQQLGYREVNLESIGPYHWTMLWVKQGQ